jgi:CRP/FNR family transcriptional regulator, cyclic AMP receptor protein
MTQRRARLDSTCHVVREDPELARSMSPRRRAHAEESCVARALNVRRGRWNQPVAGLSDGIGLLVLEGLLLRRVSVEGRSGGELLGPGDVVRPWPEAADPALRQTTAWRALQITRLAVLDVAAVERIAEYPELVRILLERSVERSRRLAVNMAIVHRPKVDVRLQLLFWHLADRWGRVRNGQTILPLRLSHSVLADLIAAQRPTVTTALSDLTSRGIVRPAPDGWLLLAPPPDDRRAPESLEMMLPRRGSTRRDRGTDPVLYPPHPRARPPRVRRVARDASPRPG